MQIITIGITGAVFVAQLAEWLLPITKDPSSNAAISYFYEKHLLFTFENTKITKKRPVLDSHWLQLWITKMFLEWF